MFVCTSLTHHIISLSFILHAVTCTAGFNTALPTRTTSQPTFKSTNFLSPIASTIPGHESTTSGSTTALFTTTESTTSESTTPGPTHRPESTTTVLDDTTAIASCSINLVGYVISVVWFVISMVIITLLSAYIVHLKKQHKW